MLLIGLPLYRALTPKPLVGLVRASHTHCSHWLLILRSSLNSQSMLELRLLEVGQLLRTVWSCNS